MRPIITVTAVVLLHLCVIAVLVGVNGCRSTSGFEQPGDNAAFSGGARPAGSAVAAPAPALDRIPTPVPAKLAPLGPVGPGGKRTVLDGETLMSIAASEKVTRADLAKANNLTLNADLKPGQVLTIPAASKPATKAGTKTAPKAAPKAGAKPAPAAAQAAPAPTFAPIKLVPLTGAKPADAAPAAPEKK
jgi:LysM repeat protein